MAYYDRKNLNPGEAVICDPCAVDRWGDPFADDDGKAAFDARYDDPSGDWCWSPRYSIKSEPYPCTSCGRPDVDDVSTPPERSGLPVFDALVREFFG